MVSITRPLRFQQTLPTHCQGLDSFFFHVRGSQDPNHFFFPTAYVCSIHTALALCLNSLAIKKEEAMYTTGESIFFPPQVFSLQRFQNYTISSLVPNYTPVTEYTYFPPAALRQSHLFPSLLSFSFSSAFTLTASLVTLRTNLPPSPSLTGADPVLSFCQWSPPTLSSSCYETSRPRDTLKV